MSANTHLESRSVTESPGNSQDKLCPTVDSRYAAVVDLLGFCKVSWMREELAKGDEAGLATGERKAVVGGKAALLEQHVCDDQASQ